MKLTDGVSTTRVAVRDAGKGFLDTLDRVVRAKEWIVFHRRGKAVAALIPAEDLERLRELEDRLDAAAARKALAERGGKAHEKVRREFGL